MFAKSCFDKLIKGIKAKLKPLPIFLDSSLSHWPPGVSSQVILLLVLFIHGLRYCPPEILPLRTFLLDLWGWQHWKITFIISTATCQRKTGVWKAIWYYRYSIVFSEQWTESWTHMESRYCALSSTGGVVRDCKLRIYKMQHVALWDC